MLDLGAKLGANEHSPQATSGHSQPPPVQVNGLLGDARQYAAMVRWCLLSSGSRVRILPGAPDQGLCGASNAWRWEPNWEPKACPEVMTQATGKRRGHGEDSIYWDESRKRYIGAVDLGLSPAGTRTRKKVSGKTKVEVRDKRRELHKATDAG